MKKIISIQSVSDIITNSSSEVFIVTKDVAESIVSSFNVNGNNITFIPLTFDYIKEQYDESDAITEVINLIKKDINLKDPLSGEVESWDEEDQAYYWKLWCNENKDLLVEVFENKNLVMLNIEDHFDYDEYQDAVEIARLDSFYSDYRH